jgi:protein TonB
MTSEHTKIPGARRDEDDGPSLLAAFTLVLWAACIVIGATGLLSQPLVRPASPTSQPTAEVVNIEFESAPAPPEPSPGATPKRDPVVAREQPAALPSVPMAALPSPAIAFAVPVAGPARIVAAAAAVPAVRSVEPVVHRLSAGVTGGDVLPQPTYPYAAEVAGQTGTVVVRFSVDADGHVTRAWVVSPSRWPLLNEEAVRAARETVQPRGTARTDEYTPTFQPRAE